MRLLGILAAFLLVACSTDPVTDELFLQELTINISDGGGAGELVPILIDDLKLRDPDGRLVLGGSEAELAIVVSVDDTAGSKEGSFRIHGEDGAYAVEAGDLLGAQYGVYELLERAGIVFVHPEETFFPEALCTACVGAIDEKASPGYTMRGTHVHTMHPIEYESTLLGHDPATLPRFKRFLGWLIARRQNYLEWNLLRTISADAWIKHAGKLVGEAHARGFSMGIVAPIAFRQQNSFFLVDGESSTPATEQMAQNIDWLMQVAWDRLNVEMGASEFLSVSDTGQVDWLSFLAQYLAQRYPETRTATKVHCTNNQTAPSYGDINFNYIVKYADPGMGIMPHTVQFYDLYRTGPTYDREDFHDMREFLLAEIGKREVFYYPETAYWVTFDNDIPIFLPQYVYSRWNDLHQLRGTGMDGQINFSSGFEWGYWLNDFSAAWHAYAPQDDYMAPVRRALAPLGAAATAAARIMDEYILWQGEHLLEQNGVRWIISWDAADDIGHFTDIHAQPIAVRLYEVAKMDPAAAASFAEGELTQLETLAAGFERFSDLWNELDERAHPLAKRLHKEIALGMQINAVRTRFMQQLYLAVVAQAQGETVASARHLAAAERLKSKGLRIANAQSATYRFPLEEIAADRTSLTSYPFGYLRTVPDLWYWGRELEMATDPAGYDFLHALYNLAESAGL
jgi:hypothetical protein